MKPWQAKAHRDRLERADGEKPPIFTKLEDPEETGLTPSHVAGFESDNGPWINPAWNRQYGRWETSPPPILETIKRDGVNLSDVFAAIYLLFNSSQLLQGILGATILFWIFVIVLLFAVR